MPLAVAADIAPMEARLAAALPAGEGWQYEPKWDGFRCIAFRDGDTVALHAKSGKPLGRYFPEVLALLAALPLRRFVLDGELVIEIDGALSFDALQARLHPAASRIRKLAAETPARLMAFDALQQGSRALVQAPLRQRRKALETLLQRCGQQPGLRLSPCTTRLAEAERWLADSGGGIDGVVAKRQDQPYASGERAMVKVKRSRSADCVIGGFRYLRDRREVGSLLLGLYDAEGRLDHVGFTSTISDAERPALTRRLEKLVRSPGFTGKAPGGPSRWTTKESSEWEPLQPKLVVEVSFDQVTAGRFRHGTRLLRWRPDKAPRQCDCAQIAPTAPPLPVF